MSAAALLVHARRKAGLTQRDLARRSGVAQPAIAKIEKGHTSPRVDTLERLLRACGSRLAARPERGFGVDRSAIRETLSLTPEQRLERATIEGRNLEDFEKSVQL